MLKVANKFSKTMGGKKVFKQVARSLLGISIFIISAIICINLDLCLAKEVKLHKCGITKYVKKVNIHGCIRFNITLNGCYGRCNSFSVVNNADVKRSLGLWEEDQTLESDPMTESDDEQQYHSSNEISRPESSSASVNGRGSYRFGDDLIPGMLPDGSLDNRIPHRHQQQQQQQPKRPRYRLKIGDDQEDDSNYNSNMRKKRNHDDHYDNIQDTGWIDEGQDFDERKKQLKFGSALRHLKTPMDASLLDEETIYNMKRMETNKDILSISRCCTTKGQPKLLSVRVLCTTGWRVVTFAESEECQCSTCSPD